MKVFNQTHLDDLILTWKENELRLNEGIDDHMIISLEEEINYKFSDDFKRYLRRINGFVDLESDTEFFSFWSTDRIKSELKDNHPKELVCFSDYWLSLCSYGFHRKTGKIYSHFQHDPKLFLIANSFTEFIKMYLYDPNLLMGVEDT